MENEKITEEQKQAEFERLERQETKKFENVEKKDLSPYFMMVMGLGLGVGAVGVVTIPLIGIGGCCVAFVSSLCQLFGGKKYDEAKKEYITGNAKLKEENEYNGKVIKRQKEKILTDEQIKKIRISIATLAYVSYPDNYDAFNMYYQTGIRKAIGSAYRSEIEDTVFRHRAYQASENGEEFRKNLEEAYAKKTSDSKKTSDGDKELDDGKILVKKR